MSNLVIYTAFHQLNQNGHAGKTALGFDMRYKKDKKRVFKVEERTYGQMWLLWVTRLLTDAKDMFEERDTITLITNQPDVIKMMEKVERCLIQCFLKQVTKRDDVAKIVYQQSKWRHLPNNDLYVDLVLQLLELHQEKRISLVTSNQSSPICSKLYKDARTKLEPGWTPKRTKRKPNLKLVVNNT